MNSRVDVLLLEDSAPDAELLGARLEEEGITARVTRVDSRESFLNELVPGRYSVILSDYNVPSYDGREALAAAREKCPDTPFLFVSGALGEERAIELLKLGATDYVLKDHLERLAPGVQRALRESKEKSERRRAEEALRESERMLQTLMANMPGMAFRCQRGPIWILEYASPGAQDLSGYSPEELGPSGTTTWESLIHPEDLDAWNKAHEKREVAQLTIRYRIRSRFGQEKWIWERTVGIGETGIEGFATDITQQVEAEEEMKKRNTLEQQLIGIVSHDLRNPLNVISLAVATALTNEELDDRVARSLLKIKSAGDRAGRMIRDLLDFTQVRLGGGIRVEPRPVDLADLVVAVVDEAETTHPGRKVRIDHDGAGKGEWDPDRLSQAIANLVTNALRHSPPSSHVSVRTKSDGERVVLEVHNDGPAIPEDLRGRLFKPMQRGVQTDRGSRSVGLGLYIVDSIINAHGGFVSMTSTDGDGTTFRLHLPRSSK